MPPRACCWKMIPSTTRRTPAVCFDGPMPPVDEADVLLIARRWARRGEHTSVERFVDYLPGAQVLTTDDLWQRPDRILHWLAIRAPHEGYTIWGVEFEARAVLRSLPPSRRPSDRPLPLRRPRLPPLGRAAAPARRAHGGDPLLLGRGAGPAAARTSPTSGSSTWSWRPGRRSVAHLAGFVEPDRLAVLPLGVDSDFFCPDPAVPPVPGRLLQVGLNRRDVDTLVAAYAAFRAADPTLTLELVGCPELAPAFAGLDGVIVAEHLDDDGLRRAYREAQVLLLPLEEGGSSNALNEALACGLPVVATDLPNLVDYAEPACGPHSPCGATPRRWPRPAVTCSTTPRPGPSAAAAARRWAEGHDWAVVRERLL